MSAMKNVLFKLFKKPSYMILGVMFCLLCIGCINVFSASFVRAQNENSLGIYYFLRYLGITIASLLFMFFVRCIGYKRLLSKEWIVGIVFLVLAMLIAVKFKGVEINGAKRWIGIAGITLQPSEFAKLVVVMLSAKVFGRILSKGERFSIFSIKKYSFLLGVTVIYAGLVYKQPDLGTAAIIFGLMLAMLFMSGISRRDMFAVGCGGLVLAGYLAICKSYRLDRLKVWLDPWSDQADKGYQIVQSQIAIGSGGLTGMPWGHGAGKFFFLPEAHTDFAFAMYCQENGFIGVVILLLLFALLWFAFAFIVFNTRNHQAFLLSSGITILVVGQSIANMAMVCGIFPVIGVPLAFISYGGSAMLTNMAAIGLMLSIYDEENKLAEQASQSSDERRNDLRMIRNERWNQ
ncbi:MAG: putative peptidoglycan glycosyltransferase FtsW [Phascolarctobacterium sp.]|nr:putative peptidoglycan glycosyltransferase FtsW [Phascolarctobacterium sp.]